VPFHDRSGSVAAKCEDTTTMNNNKFQQPVRHQPAAVPQRSGCSGCLSSALVAGLLLLMVVVVAAMGAAGALVYTNWSREIEAEIETLGNARQRETFETSQILDRDGRLLWEIFGEGKRTQIDLSAMPEHLKRATIAVEDDTFYTNNGLDAPSLAAALVANLRNATDRPVGGSTITQQLVRHIAFDYEERTGVSYERKIKEVFLAWIMNRNFTKDEILEMYLNEIYYGNLAYGIEAAANTYFGKAAADLTLGEATLLAALPQSPVELDPLANFEGAKGRQWLVLNLMVSEGFITQQEAENAYLEPLNFVAQEVSLTAPHFAVYARQQLEEMFGAERVANGGLRVITTLDLDYQRLAEERARQHVAAEGPQHNLTNASLVAMRPQTGEILAMLGSVDYDDESIDGHVNVALSAQQPGSAIKPLTYAAALSPDEQGQVSWTPGDILWDVEVEYPQADGQAYAPVNYDGRFHGPVRLRSALANSYNIPAVLLLQDIGIPALLEFGRSLGIESWQDDSSQYGLSLTLGGAEVTPLELTTAYAALANGGYRVEPVAILRVETNDGELLYEHPFVAGERALDERVAFLISDILDDDTARVPAMGQDNPLALPFPAAAKTGTTNDFRDNWTVGYTPDLAVGVWTGNTDNSEMFDVSGLTGAAPLWSDYMQSIYRDPSLLETLAVTEQAAARGFEPVAGLEQETLCEIASVVVGAADCAPGGTEWKLQTPPQAPPDLAGVHAPVTWEEVESAVARVPALALPPLPLELVAAEGDEDAPPPQLFCHFTEGTDASLLPPETQPQLFLAGPRNPESLKAAHEWAQQSNLAIMPLAPCNEELLALARDQNRVAVWRISEPKEGDTVSGVLPIVGTADFDPAVVQFYKLELGIPNGTDVQWVTLGEVHNQPVVNGTLEMLHADALPPGDYFLRLIVVKDSNYAGEPHTIAFTVDDA
jgi:penicillin-binding protein 1C